MAKIGAIMAITLAIIEPIYNVISVVTLLGSQHKIDRYVPGKIFRQIIKNPLKKMSRLLPFICLCCKI